MRVPLTTIPRTWAPSVGVTAADLDPSFSLPVSSIGQAALRPNQLGLSVFNNTGSTINAGQLLYISGWNAANNIPTVGLAIATLQTTRAMWVATAAILNNAVGTAAAHFSLTAQNTNAATVGDYVYLDVNAGGYTLTTPPANAVVVQPVGRVTVKSATVGVVDYDLVSFAEPLAVDQWSGAWQAFSTAGTYVAYARVRRPGTVIAASAIFSASDAVSGTNYVYFQIADLTGPVNLLTVGATLNTNFTGGNAIVADTNYPFGIVTGPNPSVAAGDWLKATATVTGTLANPINASSFMVVCQPYTGQ